MALPEGNKAPDWLWGWAAGATLCTAVSGVIYIWAGVHQLSASPASSPAAPAGPKPDPKGSPHGQSS